MTTPIQNVSTYETFGEFDTPVTADQLDGTLGVIDGGVHVLAELFKAAINAELSEAWPALVGATGGPAGVIGSNHPLFNTSAVADTLEIEPSRQVMTQRKALWPLLAVHRVEKGVYSWFTTEIQRLTQQWAIHYILGPLDIGDLHKLNKICVAVPKIISMVLRDCGHRAYQGGATQFFAGSGAHFAYAWMKAHEGPGHARFNDGDDTIYYAVTVTIETAEDLHDKDAAYAEFDGADYSIGVGDDQQIMPDVIDANTDAVYQDP